MSNKILSYSNSIGETIKNNMKKNKKIFVAGLEVDYSSKVFGSVEIPYKNFPNSMKSIIFPNFITQNVSRKATHFSILLIAI